MGCSFCPKMGPDPEIVKILASLDEKYEEYQETFVKEVEEVKKEQENQLKERHDQLEQKKKENKEITEDFIKELNKKELEVEIHFLANETNKLHYIFDLGLTFVEPIRKFTLNKLLEKAKSAPAVALSTINKQIEEVKNIPIVEFFNATYGKVLKDALVKKGFSATLLNSFKKQLMKDRGERRKKERDEFKIKVNEFKEENIDELKLDLFELVDKEYDENIEKNFKGYVRDKLIDAMFQK